MGIDLMNNINGLYSKNHFLLDSIQSLISGSRIFTGNQPDEFAIGSTVTPGNRVLLLGLGFGATIRPLIASIPQAEITVVDNDPNIIKACSSLFSHLFPSINQVNYLYGDASKIKEFVTTSFDLICVDLFTDTHYPAFVLETSFWESIRSLLTSKGSIVVNTWGLPTHLSPFDGYTPQTRIIQLVHNCFKNTYSFPFRRNLTIVGSQSEPNINDNLSNYKLHDLDRVYLDMFSLRWRIPHQIDKYSVYTDQNYIEIKTSHSQMDEEMINRLNKWIYTINLGLNDLGYLPVNSQTLKEIIYDPKRAQAITEWLLNEGSYEAAFIPNFIGSYAFTNPKGLEWYPKWIIENSDKLFQRDKFWFVNIALVQLLSLMNNPFATFDEFTNDIIQMTRKLKSTEV